MQRLTNSSWLSPPAGWGKGIHYPCELAELVLDALDWLELDELLEYATLDDELSADDWLDDELWDSTSLDVLWLDELLEYATLDELLLDDELLDDSLLWLSLV
jgi:hypothetical protein